MNDFLQRWRKMESTHRKRGPKDKKYNQLKEGGNRYDRNSSYNCDHYVVSYHFVQEGLYESGQGDDDVIEKTIDIKTEDSIRLHCAQPSLNA
jgi:hypothetical protein